MEKPPKRRVSIFQIIAEAYAQLDQVAENVAAQAKVTCTKGCANCCYLLAMASTLEGVNIAGFLLRHLKKDEFEKAMMELRMAARKSDYPGLDHASYFKLHVACPFLTAEKTCAVYSVRPAACRYHYVISPKENCSPVALDNTTRTIDMRKLEEEVFQLDMDIRGELPVLAPIPIMVLHCMKALLEASTPGPESEALYTILMKAIDGVATPEEWLAKHGGPVTASTIKGISKPIPVKPILVSR